MYSTCPSREVDHFLGWTASRSGTVGAVYNCVASLDPVVRDPEKVE